MICDGASSENITGVDQFPEFVELGYDLFGDKESLKSKFLFGNFFADDFTTKILNENEMGTFDIAYSGNCDLCFRNSVL